MTQKDREIEGKRERQKIMDKLSVKSGGPIPTTRIEAKGPVV